MKAISARAAFPVILCLTLLVGACAGPVGFGGVSPVAVDTRAAAASTTAFRTAQGRGPVTANSRLNAIAERQAMAMARRGRLGHDLIGPLHKRLKGAGYVWLVAVENVSAGYDDFDAALAGWQTSTGHRSNLLEPQATEIGVGAARADDKYGTYWALILAAPDPDRDR
ncbi:CAP domain-containing protein [Microbaculum sp. FT89]|uniref:CAP domain-containing protein n=1 Tax=Microbaculum sp. FT89 TaxID=3447298 RepID=UPI003F53D63F